VTDALLARPELRAADRAVDLRRDEVRMAVAAFLPDVFATLAGVSSSDSYLVHPDVYSLGLMGVMTVFDGFRNVGEYRAAKVREEAELLDRERTALAVILEVVEAHRQAAEAAADRRLAEAALRAAERKLKETESRFREGMARESDRLAAIAARDRARAGHRVASFRERVARATLRDVTGAKGEVSR
jgi:outer membrane protein TolC